MKSASFEYIKAQSLGDVFAAFDRADEDVRILAGGQSLVPTMNLRLATPDVLVDINGVPGLSEITLMDESLRIGGLVRHAEIGFSELVSKHAHLLALSAPYVAHEGVRNRGTMGGSLVTADPASEFPACMVALGANINLASRAGMRSVTAEEFFLGTYYTAIEPDEVLVSVDIPLSGDDYKSAFSEISRRSGDFALAGVAAHGRVEDGKLFGVRLVFFGVEDRPRLAVSVAEVLEGQPTDTDVIANVNAAIDADLISSSTPQASGEYKLHLAKVLCRQVLQRLTQS